MTRKSTTKKYEKIGQKYVKSQKKENGKRTKKTKKIVKK